MSKTFAKSPIRDLMKTAGIEMVSKDAVDALIDILEVEAKKITNGAMEMMRHSGRKKLLKSDIELAQSL